jgi:hypothetical protein
MLALFPFAAGEEDPKSQSGDYSSLRQLKIGRWLFNTPVDRGNKKQWVLVDIAWVSSGNARHPTSNARRELQSLWYSFVGSSGMREAEAANGLSAGDLERREAPVFSRHRQGGGVLCRLRGR